MSRPAGRNPGRKGPADELYADVGELRSARAELDRMIEARAAGLASAGRRSLAVLNDEPVHRPRPQARRDAAGCVAGASEVVAHAYCDG